MKYLMLLFELNKVIFLVCLSRLIYCGLVLQFVLLCLGCSSKLRKYCCRLVLRLWDRGFKGCLRVNFRLFFNIVKVISYGIVFSLSFFHFLLQLFNFLGFLTVSSCYRMAFRGVESQYWAGLKIFMTTEAT